MIQARALFLIGLSTLTDVARAEDLGFRYRDGRCLNDAGVEGYNPQFIGPCADLSGAVLGRLDMSGLDLSGAKLDGVDFRLSKLVDAKLVGAKLDGANLMGVEIAGADLSRASLGSTILRKAKAFGAKFVGARLEEADLSEIDAGEADFSEAVLTNAKLDVSMLSGVKLRGATLHGTRLRRAVMDGADLTNADVSGADLRNANLSDGTLTGVTWTGAMISRRTILPLSAEEIAQLGVTTRELLFEFNGTKRNVPMAELEGWRICHTSLYETPMALSAAFDACRGEKLMLACRRTGEATFVVAAYGDRNLVTTDIGNGSDAATEANGVRFYYSNSYSIGFGPMGQPLSRNSCDTQMSGAEDRLCWHTSGDSFSNGWRCGATTNLYSNTGFERVMLVPEE